MQGMEPRPLIAIPRLFTFRLFPTSPSIATPLLFWTGELKHVVRLDIWIEIVFKNRTICHRTDWHWSNRQTYIQSFTYQDSSVVFCIYILRKLIENKAKTYSSLHPHIITL